MKKSYDIVLVTGASSGIGRALARRYLDRGATVGVCGRDKARLDEICSGHVRARPLIFDVADRTAATEAIEAFERDAGPVDLAILNAGTHQASDAAAFDAALYERLATVNYLGVINCLAPLIPSMKNRKAGVIALMGSAAGVIGLPNAGAYCASKSAVMRLAETLHVELEIFNIDVRLITPGFVETPLTARNDFPMPFLMSVEEAARRIETGLAGRAFEIAFPRRLIWPLRLLSLLPRPLYFRLARNLLPDERSL